MHNPIEYAAGLTTAATDEPPRRIVRVYPGEEFCFPLKEGEPVSVQFVRPLTDIATGFGVLGAVFTAVTVAGWAVVQLARGAGWVAVS